MDGPKIYHKSADEIEGLVNGFEGCTISPGEFTHGAHLLVALSYLHLSGLTVSEATARMREGLYRFIDRNGVDRRKYNETITLFWIKLVRSFLDKTDRSRPAAEIANQLVEAYPNSQFVFTYYSTERLLSEEARERWVEPDLRPLDF